MLKVNAYVWIFWFLHSDALCDRCKVQPCRNGGVCESHHSSYRCLCSEQSQDGRLYGGKNCTVVLRGCHGDPCRNGGTCSPLFTGGQHIYQCTCPAGFSGPTCQVSTVFSFETRGYAYVGTWRSDPGVPLNVTFSFRTARRIGTLTQLWMDDLLLTVGLADGRLRLSSLRGRRSSDVTLLQELPGSVSDGQWHGVEASLGGVASSVRLLDSLCTERSCTEEIATESGLLEEGSSLPELGSSLSELGSSLPELGSSLPKLGSVRQMSLFMGAVVGGSQRSLFTSKMIDSDDDDPQSFLGCFRNVLVDSRLVPVGELLDSPARANVTAGCSDKNGCEQRPCQNGGRCVSQGWRRYVCECRGPYEGPDCTKVNTAVVDDTPRSSAFFWKDVCHPNPCQHNGTCHKDINGAYYCVCEFNWGGQICQIDINLFYLVLFFVTWQNVFQVFSWLILHMDDDEGIDWEWEYWWYYNEDREDSDMGEYESVDEDLIEQDEGLVEDDGQVEDEGLVKDEDLVKDEGLVKEEKK